MYWQQVLSRLSIPGLVLLGLGAVACTQAPKCIQSRRTALIVQIAGIAAALLGAVILLDLIPGL